MSEGQNASGANDIIFTGEHYKIKTSNYNCIKMS